MKSVREVMKSPPITVKPDDPIPSLRDLAERHRIRHFPVVRNGKVVGIVSDRNLRALNLLRELAASLEQAAAETVMVRDVVTVAPETSVQEAARLMVERQVGCLPVVKDGALVGIVTRSDLLAMLAAQRP